MLQTDTHEMNTRSHSMPVTESSPVCTLAIGARYTTLTSGSSRNSRITTSPEFSAGIELGRDIARNDKIISSTSLARLEHTLAQMRKLCENKGISSVPGVASAAVSSAANSTDVQALAERYDFQIELIDSQRECELDYQAVTNGRPNQLVCTLRSHSCNTAWLYDGGIETNHVDAGYEEAFDQFVRNASSIAEACSAFGMHLKNYLDFLPIAMNQLIVTTALPCAGYISDLDHKAAGSTILSRPDVTGKLQDLQSLSKLKFEHLTKLTGNISELLPGIIFIDYLLHRTNMEQVLVTDSGLSTAMIRQHFNSGNAASS